MFSEPPLSSFSYSIPPMMSIPTSPISSASASPLSSASHSRTSTITSNSYQKTDILPNLQSNLTSNSCQQQQQQHRQMKIGKYYLEKTIGKGNFAVVKLATHCDTHQKVAIKIIDKSRLDPTDHKKLEREIAVMKSLIHPYIIRLYEVMESKNLIYLVTEYASNGELLDLLIREKRLSEAKAKEKFRQLVLAVEYIHSKNIVHRDLKAENLLLDSRGNIKVADFGFANIFQPHSKLQTFCGSPPYAAPELYQCLPYSPEKVDVWSLGVLLYVFVCGHLPFDSHNLAELRKRVLSGQFRLPFYISSDCASLISHMLTVNPEQRYTVNDIKKHPWLMLTNSNVTDPTSSTQSMVNCQLTNAILDHAELLGYNRTQILKSVNGNSYDSDAAIWHLLLEKFQQTCHIDSSHIPIESVFNDDVNNSDLTRRSTAPIIFDGNNAELVYSAPNTAESIRPQLDPCDLQRISQQDMYHRQDPDMRIEYSDAYDDDDDDDDSNDHNHDDGEEDDEDEVESAQLLERYTRTHGLRRHTIGRPDLMAHGGPIPNLASKVRFAHQSSSIEPSLLTKRLSHLQHHQQNQQQYNLCSTLHSADGFCSQSSNSIYQQKDTHSTSYNGLAAHTPLMHATSDVHNYPQLERNWLSPNNPDTFNMNRRASDSGAHLLLLQQQYGATNSNTFNVACPTQLPSPMSNQSSRGSITRGAPITLPTFSITPHEDDEDKEHKNLNDDEDDDTEILARYLNRGKRHTVCEQGLVHSGKARRGTRDPVKERSSSSRRASDTSSHFINSNTRAHFERLYNNAVNSKASEDDLTTSSLQELQKLQKQVQKHPTNTSETSMIRRSAAVPSPTNSPILHMIQEEHHHQNNLLSVNYHYPHRDKSRSVSSSETSATVNIDEHAMDCDIYIVDMRTITEADILPVRPLEGARTSTESMSTNKTISPHLSRSNSNNSIQESVTEDYIVVPSSPSSIFPPDTSSEEILEDNLFDNEDEIDYLTEFVCPTDDEHELSYSYDDDENNDDIFLKSHLTKQQLDATDQFHDKNYQRHKRSHKKMNAQRQIKTKHVKSIKIKSHNKHLYIHHRLAKKVVLDEPSLHCIPGSQSVRLYTFEELRSIVYQHRHGYYSLYTDHSTSSRKPRHIKSDQAIYVDESQTNSSAYQFREYTLNEYNIPDEPSYDDVMVTFLLEMQNRDLSPEDYEMLLRLDERIQRKTVHTSILDTLPTVTVNEIHLDDHCTICMENYTLGQKLKLLPCTHVFHCGCIETYLKEFSIQCPLDNLPLV
ncbi:hypothetical protein I4U23_008001 [Adineta vaga]|nr:hypothetical protein I4U23_008001 [Adineta vaga]